MSQCSPAQPLPRLLNRNRLPTLPRPTHPHDRHHQLHLLLANHPPQRGTGAHPRLCRRRNHQLLRHPALRGPKSANDQHDRYFIRPLRRLRLLRVHGPYWCLPQETLNVVLAIAVEPGADIERDVDARHSVRRPYPRAGKRARVSMVDDSDEWRFRIVD